MKTLLIATVAFAIATAPAFAAEKKSDEKKSDDKKTPKSGESFSGSGTVTKNEIDICMVTGLRWMLHPENGEEVKIYPKTDRATKQLDDAAKNKSTVHVSGTWKQSVECHYVETSKISVSKK